MYLSVLLTFQNITFYILLSLVLHIIFAYIQYSSVFPCISVYSYILTLLLLYLAYSRVFIPVYSFSSSCTNNKMSGKYSCSGIINSLVHFSLLLYFYFCFLIHSFKWVSVHAGTELRVKTPCEFDIKGKLETHKPVSGVWSRASSWHERSRLS